MQRLNALRPADSWPCSMVATGTIFKHVVRHFSCLALPRGSRTSRQSRLTLFAFRLSFLAPMEHYRLYSDDPMTLPAMPLVYRFCRCPLGCRKPLCLLDAASVEQDMCAECRVANCTCECLGCWPKSVLKRPSGPSGAGSVKRHKGRLVQ